MTKEELAALLNGREYGDEITEDEANQAKKAGLIIIFGYSDDNAELRGAVNDEIGVCDGGSFRVSRKGVIYIDEEEAEVLMKHGFLDAFYAKGAIVEAVWDEEGYSWTYKTGLPHATFEIVEDGEKYCRGIVINAKDLPE